MKFLKIKGVLVYKTVHNICIMKYITTTSQVLYKNWKYTFRMFLSYMSVV